MLNRPVNMDRIFSFLNVLKIISDVESFRKWLRDYHQIDDDSSVLDGYAFFVEVVNSNLIDSFCLSSAFDLEEDIIYTRAKYVGVYIDEIPNTCEKTVFLKNLWNTFKNIDEQSSWKKIKVYWENTANLFLIFDKIYDEYTIHTTSIDKDFSLKAATAFYTYIFLNDTNRGKPHTYPAPVLKNKLNRELLEKSYVGYVLCLQYLWYVLLGKEEFEKSSLTSLHKAFEKYHDKLDKKHPLFPFLDEQYDDKTLTSLIKWKSLDCFFSVIKSEIIEPLENEIGESYFRKGLLTLNSTFDTSNLSDLLSKNNLQNPDYLSNDTNIESKIKKLDYHFLWEMFFKIDCHQIILDGATPFVELLIGAVGKNKLFNIEDKIELLRIKHPAIGKTKFDYTYAILVESYSNFSDYSVWYVFFDCATDYSGFGGTLHQNIELFLEKYEKEDAINVRDITIEKDFFEKYLDQGILSAITRIRNEAEGILENTRGTPLEKIAYEVNKEIKQWNIESQEALMQNIENLVFVLKSNVPQNSENDFIFDKIKEIELSKDVIKHYSIISLIIPLLIKINMDEKLDSIDKKITDIDFKIDGLVNTNTILEYVIESLLIVKNGMPEFNDQINDVLTDITDKSNSTEQKLKISIPIIPTLVAYEFEKDVSDIVSKRIKQLDKLKIKLREYYKW